MSSGEPPRGLSRFTDEQLVEECRQGNGHAWGVLVERYKTLVYSIPMKFRMPEEDAADVFQNVWLDLHSEMERLREPAALKGWLVSVTSHKCLRWKERESKRAGVALGWETSPEPTDSRPLPGEIELQAEQEQIVRDAVESIPERCRRMIRMLFYEHPPRPYLEVARELGLAEGSIGFIRGRCLDKMKKALEKFGFSR